MPVDTREAILDAALELFAAHGYDGVSIRQITGRAGVNVASVHYHFGGKEAVLRGVTDRVMGPLNDRRIELLATVLDASSPAPLERILDAFVRPDVETLVELQERGPTVAHLMGRVYSDRSDWIQAMAAEQFAPTREHFLPAFRETLPHLDANELRWRLSNLVALIVHLFATWPDEGMTVAEADATVGRLIAFVAPGLAGPPPGRPA